MPFVAQEACSYIDIIIYHKWAIIYPLLLTASPTAEFNNIISLKYIHSYKYVNTYSSSASFPHLQSEINMILPDYTL